MIRSADAPGRRLAADATVAELDREARALARAWCAGDAAARQRGGGPTLGDARRVVAREHGLAGWAALEAAIEARDSAPIGRFVALVRDGDVDGLARLLAGRPALRERLDDPLFEFGRTAAMAARDDLPMLDLLIAHGADIDRRSGWERGGFGILDDAPPDVAEALIARGATVDAWSAAHLGRFDELQRLVVADPALVDAPGGDGKRPLHFAATEEIADFLLGRGARIDALDDDHGSTAAEHLVADRPDVARFLVGRGARADLLLLVALGETGRVARLLDADPETIRRRVSRDWYPMIDTGPNGGHVYQWTLGFHASAFDVARRFGRAETLALLEARAPARERWLDALWRGEVDAAAAIAGEWDLDAATASRVAEAARLNRPDAVLAMRARGFPPDARTQHGATALHFAAFHGNADLVRGILAHDPPLEDRDHDFASAPLGWAIHGATQGWPGLATGDHAGAVRALLEAGAICRVEAYPTGVDAIDAVLRSHLCAGRAGLHSLGSSGSGADRTEGPSR